MPDCVKIKQLHVKLTSTAAIEIKLLTAFQRSVKSVITPALNSGASRMTHGNVILFAHETHKRYESSRDGDQQVPGFLAGGARILSSDNGQSLPAGPICTRWRGGGEIIQALCPVL